MTASAVEQLERSDVCRRRGIRHRRPHGGANGRWFDYRSGAASTRSSRRSPGGFPARVIRSPSSVSAAAWRELRVVDVQVELDELARAGSSSCAGSGTAPRRPPATRTAAPSRSMADTPRSGTQHRRRPAGGAGLLGDLLAEPVVLLRRGAHQRDVRVVLVEAPAAELLRHRVRRAEVDHVQRPERDHLRHAAQRRRRQPVAARAVRMPPTSSSASSVVVMSSTPRSGRRG